jgi:hypothetical protein
MIVSEKRQFVSPTNATICMQLFLEKFAPLHWTEIGISHAATFAEEFPTSHIL